MRSPWASDAPIISSSDFTARSTSSALRWACRSVRISISSDLVISSRRAVPWLAQRAARHRCRAARLACCLLGLALELLAQQRAELGGTAGSVRRGLVVLGQGFLGLGLVLGLDRQLHQAALAIGAGDLGLDLVADLELLARVLDT